MDLESLQREMAAAVMQPLTKDDSMRSTATDGRAMTEVAASFIAPNSRLTAFDRLEIYNRQYWYRVLGALAEDFPALRALIGERRFEALSIAYLTEHPSRSFTLRNLGSKLPEWLSDHPQHAGRRHRLAADLARMEWASIEAFDAPERDPLTQRQIAALQGESKLTLQPCLQLVALSYPADDIVLELHKREKRQTSEAGVAHEESRQESCNSKAAPAAHVACRASCRSVGVLPAHRARRISDACRTARWPRSRRRDRGRVRGFAHPAASAPRARARMVWQLGRVGLDLRRLITAASFMRIGLCGATRE